MEERKTRIALVGIIVEDMAATEAINNILHAYSDAVIGRMGIPYRKRGVAIISLVLDASEPEIGALCGKLGMLPGVSIKTVYSKK